MLKRGMAFVVIVTMVGAQFPDARADSSQEIFDRAIPELQKIDQQADQEDEQDLKFVRKEQRIERKTARWIRRLNAALPRAEKDFDQAMAQMSEQEIEGQIAQIKHWAARNHKASIAEEIDQRMTFGLTSKQVLKQAFTERYEVMIPELAKQIAEAGGVVKLMIQLKREASKARSSRGPAQANEKNRYQRGYDACGNYVGIGNEAMPCGASVDHSIDGYCVFMNIVRFTGAGMFITFLLGANGAFGSTLANGFFSTSLSTVLGLGGVALFVAFTLIGDGNDCGYEVM